jgi:hypothetical protein
MRFCEGKVSVKGETDAMGPPVVPVPVRVTICGLPDALSAIEIAAVRVPEAVGVNTAVMVQFAAAISVEPQLFVWEKSPGFAPVIVMAEMDNVALPVLNKVTPLLPLLVPTA